MDNQDLTQMPETGEDEDDAAPVINGWSAFLALLLGVGFVIHMTFPGISDKPMTGLNGRIQFFFLLLGGVGVTGLALAGLIRMRKPKSIPTKGQDLV